MENSIQGPDPSPGYGKIFIFFLKLDHFLRTFCKKCIFTIENQKKNDKTTSTFFVPFLQLHANASCFLWHYQSHQQKSSHINTFSFNLICYVLLLFSPHLLLFLFLFIYLYVSLFIFNYCITYITHAQFIIIQYNLK